MIVVVDQISGWSSLVTYGHRVCGGWRGELAVDDCLVVNIVDDGGGPRSFDLTGTIPNHTDPDDL